MRKAVLIIPPPVSVAPDTVNLPNWSGGEVPAKVNSSVPVNRIPSAKTIGLRQPNTNTMPTSVFIFSDLVFEITSGFIDWSRSSLCARHVAETYSHGTDLKTANLCSHDYDHNSARRISVNKIRSLASSCRQRQEASCATFLDFW